MEKGQIHYNVDGFKGVTETWNIVQHEVNLHKKAFFNYPVRQKKSFNFMALGGLYYVIYINN